ncbi:MAG: portal protein [Alphaproteobacteria bacterium]
MQEKLQDIISRYKKAKSKKDSWEEVWQDCYFYAFPQRENVVWDIENRSVRKDNQLFDGTAPDAVDQLASSLLAELTPPWARWFGLKAGNELTATEREQVAPILEKTTEVMLQNFEHSNFAIEVHQCYLDLVTAGTACLMFEEANIGEATAFRFSAVPLREIAFEQSGNGKIETTYRLIKISIAELKTRFPEVKIPQEILINEKNDAEYLLSLIEVVSPRSVNGISGGYEYQVLAWDEARGEQSVFEVKKGVFDTSPYINFRWLKAPGEIYGRSPVMKALPDIKTANKVVELILKNASISVTGIWQAEDDGILNPANIKLVPGAIIPKAVGSKGLTPLEAPGKFDVSQLVLQDLRNRINHAMLADRLAQIEAPSMTATEVLERSVEIARILGASFGRLQSELLTPLLKRAFHILRRRGDIMNFDLDGKIVDLQYKSPLAMAQARQDVGNIKEWVNLLGSLGEEGNAAVNLFETAKWLGKTLNVLSHLIVETQKEIVSNEQGL